VAEGESGEARRGNWLWTLLTGALLVVMELVLLAALVPASWSETVRATEHTWLEQGLGADGAKAVVAQAEDWYERLFVASGLVAASYRLTLPTDQDVAQAGALAPLATLPLWSWVAGRLKVIWAALYQVLQRLALLAAWWPFLVPLLSAAAGDGWLRRRIRQAGFAYASPLVHAYALRGITGLSVGIGVVLLLPIPLPALAVPVAGALLAVLLDLVVANAQKRL
jgi:hypothetical protein